jgi:CRISPR-associated endonuclease/helicase Cas3
VQLWERYRAVRDDPTLTPAEQDQQFRRFKRAFYDRVIHISAQAARGLDRNDVNRIDAGPQIYDRNAGFVGLPGATATCIF